MRRLMHANFARWKKSRSLWIGAAGMAALGVCLCLMTYRMLTKFGVSVEGSLDGELFGGAMLEGIVIAVFCSLFVGTEYNDGTIRNKIISGHMRSAVYMANYISCAAAGTVFFLVSVLAACAVGLPLFGLPSVPLPTLLWITAAGLFMSAAYAAVGNFIGMLVPNRTYSTVISLLAAFAGLLAGSYLVSRLGEPRMLEVCSLSSEGEMLLQMEPNPLYLTGAVREICAFFADLLPGGQAYQIGNFLVERPYRILGCAAAETAVLNAAGIWLFKRKDLK